MASINIIQARGSPSTVSVAAAIALLPFTTFAVLDDIRRLVGEAADRF